MPGFFLCSNSQDNAKKLKIKERMEKKRRIGRGGGGGSGSSSRSSRISIINSSKM